jgi:hypothetical protein
MQDVRKPLTHEVEVAGTPISVRSSAANARRLAALLMVATRLGNIKLSSEEGAIVDAEGTFLGSEVWPRPRIDARPTQLIYA